MSRPRLIALLLALATLAVYLPVVNHGFILYDDGDYVTQNKMVQDGWTLAGIQWAFTTFHSANWHPLTWLSHMTDCELFGSSAAGPHFVNVLLHVANTVLLFALWLQLARREPKTGGLPVPDPVWPAAFVAALFALHPQHVESVAWVAERKDVLSTFFGLLALLFYARFVMSEGGRPKFSYWLALFFFACGLMSKPMLVTLPFIMLLLDYWPLARWNAAALPRLLVEKIPFFALTAASCVITYIAQSHGDAVHIHGAVQTLAEVPLTYRLANVPVTLAEYLLKLAWPARLALIYPMPHRIPPVAIAVPAAILLLITLAAWMERKRNPFLLMGWLWFLGTLVPVIGLVKVGDAAMADRYMYLPSIGIFVALAFGAQKIVSNLSLPKLAPVVGAVVVLGALAAVTERQLQFWRDDVTLFRHAMEVTTDNVDSIINYGAALEYHGKPMEAITQYQRAEQLDPGFYMAYADLGNLLYYTGQTNAALQQYQRAVALSPKLRELRDGLGNVLAGMGRFAEATNEYAQAARLDPGSAPPHYYLGIALAGHGDYSRATNEFARVMAMAPLDPSPLVEWSKALLKQGCDADAVEKLHQALQVGPDDFPTLAFTARVLAADEDPKIRDGQAALAYAQQADALTDSTQPLVQDALGMAYAENGQFDDAQKAASEAIRLATVAGMKSETIADIQKRLELYKNHQPWRESFLSAK
jgi:tetratricopeptide (TPR) repeat protein